MCVSQIDSREEYISERVSGHINQAYCTQNYFGPIVNKLVGERTW